MNPPLLPLQWLPWALYAFAAATLVFLPASARRAGAIAVAAAWAVGLAAGDLGVAALPAPAALLVAGWSVRRERVAAVRAAGHALFVAVGLALALHRLPGFRNVLAMGPAPLTDGAVPFSLYLNLDKPLVGFWILLAWPARVGRPDDRRRPIEVVGVFVLTAIACAALALGSGLMAWAPKWPERAWLWAANNLLLVAMAEEAFFRGYVQSAFERFAAARGGSATAALLAAAALFGLAHAAGGWRWIAVASAAGVGYGLAYRAGGLRAAMLAHFALNLLHFGWLTYPSLAGG